MSDYYTVLCDHSHDWQSIIYTNKWMKKKQQFDEEEEKVK